MVKARLNDGGCITGEWHGLRKVAELADEACGRNLVSESQSTNGDVIPDLKGRNPDILQWAFQPRASDKKRWTWTQPEFAKKTGINPDDWTTAGG